MTVRQSSVALFAFDGLEFIDTQWKVMRVLSLSTGIKAVRFGRGDIAAHAEFRNLC